MDSNWENLKDEATRASEIPMRLFITLQGNNGTNQKLTKVIYPADITDDTYRLTLPSKLKAASYSIAIWADCLLPESLDPAGYDISDPWLIKELRPRGEESDYRACLTGLRDFTLRNQQGEWDTSEEVEISLSSPMGRIRLVADDYQEFLDQTEEARSKGETYRVAVSYESDIPGGFSLPDGQAMDPVSGSGFTTPLPIIVVPGIEMCIASDWLFNPPGRHTHTVTVSVYNSALVMVSQTSGIPVPVERGKITTVTGQILTNFITGGITLDNIWAGEITIEVD